MPRGQHRPVLEEFAMITRTTHNTRLAARCRGTPIPPSPQRFSFRSRPVRFVAFAATFLLLSMATTASAITLEQTINRLNIQAAQNATIGALDSLETLSRHDLAWTGTVSDSAWDYSTSGELNNKLFTLTLHGSLVGAEGDTLVTVISGTGLWGSEPITVSGTSTWLYDATLAGYSQNEHLQLTQLGAHTSRFWKVARFVGGAILGAAAAVALAPATATVLVVAGVAIAGGMAGGVTTVEVGKYVDEWCGGDSNRGIARAAQACPPPELPAALTLPPVGEEFNVHGLGVTAVDETDMASLSEDLHLFSKATVDPNGNITGILQTAPILPAVSAWGMSAVVVLLLAAGAVFIVRNRFSETRA